MTIVWCGATEPTAEFSFEALAVPAKVTKAKEELPKSRSFNIKAIRMPNGTYAVSYGTTGIFSFAAPSMASALRLLADQFEASGEYGSTEEKLADFAKNPHSQCKYCQAPIFFARLPPPSMKFLAFDTVPVDAQEVQGIRVATFTKLTDPRGRPLTRWLNPKKGPVWIPHPETCGQREDAPLNSVLKNLWEPRREVNMGKQNHVVKRLREIINVEVGALHGNGK